MVITVVIFCLSILTYNVSMKTLLGFHSSVYKYFAIIQIPGFHSIPKLKFPDFP